MKRQGRTFTRGRLRLSRFVGSRSANKTAQPKNRKVGVTRMTARSTSVERLGDSLIGGSQRKRPFPSQVRDERFHFKLNVGRQSPQPLPIEHAGTLFCVHNIQHIAARVSDACHTSGGTSLVRKCNMDLILAQTMRAPAETSCRLSAGFSPPFRKKTRPKRQMPVDLQSSRIGGETMIALR
jgi:hypothetical protein